ncbi:hypothetical protein JM16_005454 [Phytophthora kernoviae]|uniref:Uncharacterized protein n=1 Tax=Phytophthora kernoviae TaxID=325452 RepID=A0A8T0LND0_9STRA|nr:hypothetical protein JM16_005454 [Phytophthora kernoviae]
MGVAAMFGSTPYVIVEKYNAGKKCDVAELSGIMTYAADGMCHQTDTEASYRALRSLDGTVTVKTYSTAADCSGDPTTTLSVTTAQAKGNSCASDANGMADTKIFGNGFSPLYLSTGNYDTNTGGCKAPAIPTQQIASVVTADTCSATSSCAGTVAPFSAQSCSPMLTYKTDTAATFGQNPYVLVEKYTAGTGCVSGQLPAITTYLADGKCHLTNAASSYKAVKASDGSSTIKAYADSSCNAAWMTLAVNATQAAGNLCTTGIIDTKVYGGGVTSTCRADDRSRKYVHQINLQ